MQLPLFSNGQPTTVFVVTRRMERGFHPYVQEFFDNTESAEKFVNDWAEYADGHEYYEVLEYSPLEMVVRNSLDGQICTMVFEVWEISLADALNILFNKNEDAKGLMLQYLVDKRNAEKV